MQRIRKFFAAIMSMARNPFLLRRQHAKLALIHQKHPGVGSIWLDDYDDQGHFKL